MADIILFRSFIESIAEKSQNLGSDQLKIALTNTFPNNSVDTLFSDIVEITAENGYSAGGYNVGIAKSAGSSGIYRLIGQNSVIQPTGGSIGPFRVLVLYNSISNDLIGFWDLGRSITLREKDKINLTYGNFIVDFRSADITPDVFIATWKTDNTSTGSSNSNQVKLPLESSGTYNFTVDWGDGTSDTITAWDQAEVTHTYATIGTYTTKITGQLEGFRFNNTGDRNKILDIGQFGTGFRLGNSGGYFYSCANLIDVGSDLNLSGMTNLASCFRNCGNFVGAGIRYWDISNITSLHAMFESSSFNQDIGLWQTGKVIDMSRLFVRATQFNQDIGDWDTSNVTSMAEMFYETPINCDLSKWDVSKVQNMRGIFRSAASFNQDISNWNPISATRTDLMFQNAVSFNQDIGRWDVSNISNMSGMFDRATSFNQDIGGWNVSNAVTMGTMFYGATSFNQDISNWDVSNVTSMASMFEGATSFNQDLGDWDVSNVTNMSNMFLSVTLSTANYDSLLLGWSDLILKNGVSFHGGNSKFSPGFATTARQSIIDTYAWTITDGGQVDEPAYQILVKTDNTGTSGTNQFTLPATGTYDVDWGDGVVETGLTGSQTHTYPSAGEFVVKISGGLQRITFNNGGDKLKLLEIQNWGDPTWTSFNAAYYGCSNLQITAIDLPNSGGVTDFSQAWRNCTSLTSFPLINTSNGTNFTEAWRNCTSLTSFPLIDTSSGTNFTNTWNSCLSLSAFPQINTSSGTNFYGCWQGCSALASFPLINTGLGTNFSYTWDGCSSLTSFPLLNTSSGTSFIFAWSGCSSLTSFPIIDTSSGTTFSYAWSSCSALTSFPLIDTSIATTFNYTWSNCTSLVSFPLISTGNCTSFYRSWTNCSSLESFPLIDTSNGTTFYQAWLGCSSLTSFSLISFASMVQGTQCFFNVTLPTETWSQLLINTEASNNNANVSWHGGNSKYSAGSAATARQALVDDHAWVITDGGLEP